jgi:hypothetical protein
MINHDSTVDKIITRLIEDWESLPVGIRRTAMPETILQLQKLCRCHEIMENKLLAELPSEQAAKEMASLYASFRLGCFDHVYKTAVDNQPVPWDISNDIPEIGMIFKRADNEMESARVQRHQQLQKQVDTATFEQMREDLCGDVKKLEAWHDKRESVRNTWESRVATHKRIRRKKGELAVNDLMNNQLSVRKLDNLSTIALEYSDFKMTVNKHLPQLSGATTIT